MNSNVYLERNKLHCELNTALIKFNTKSDKFVFLLTLIIPAFLIILYLFKAEPFLIFVIGVFSVGGASPLLLTKTLRILDKKRHQRILKQFLHRGIPLEGKLYQDNSSYKNLILKFEHGGKSYLINFGQVAIGRQTLDIKWFAEPKHYAVYALQNNEDVALLFDDQAKEIFFIGTPSLNISEIIRSQNNSTNA